MIAERQKVTDKKELEKETSDMHMITHSIPYTSTRAYTLKLKDTQTYAN